MELKIIILIVVVLLLGVFVIIYGFMKVANAPVPFNKTWVGTIFFVFEHEGNIAKLAPIEWISSKNKSESRKFIIPESFGRLEVGKTYELLYKKEGEGFIFKQVAVMLG